MVFPLVETRGIEPLTPALQTCGGSTTHVEDADQPDARRGGAGPRVPGCRQLDATVDAILSTVEGGWPSDEANSVGVKCSCSSSGAWQPNGRLDMISNQPVRISTVPPEASRGDVASG